MWWDALLLLEGVDRIAGAARAGLDRTLLGGMAGPLTATSGRADGRPLTFDRGAVVVDIDLPDEPDREAMWRRALGDGAPAELVTWSAARYAMTPGRILTAAGPGADRA